MGRGMTELWEWPNEDKLGELLLYAAGQLLDDPAGGAVKINKVLYFAECAHIRTYGVPITGAAYQKLPQGPAPRRFVPVRDRLIANGDLVPSVEERFGRPLHRLTPRRAPRVGVLSQQELDTVDAVVDALSGKSGTEVSEMSHEEPGWIMVEENEDIPLSTAYLPRRAVMSEAARRRARELAADLPSVR
jgi:hypothetical protein